MISSVVQWVVSAELPTVPAKPGSRGSAILWAAAREFHRHRWPGRGERVGDLHIAAERHRDVGRAHLGAGPRHRAEVAHRRTVGGLVHPEPYRGPVVPKVETDHRRLVSGVAMLD